MVFLYSIATLQNVVQDKVSCKGRLSKTKSVARAGCPRQSQLQGQIVQDKVSCKGRLSKTKSVARADCPRQSHLQGQMEGFRTVTHSRPAGICQTVNSLSLSQTLISQITILHQSNFMKQLVIISIFSLHLTHKAPITTAVDDIYKYVFIVFQRK